MRTKKNIGVDLILGGIAFLKTRNTKPKKAKPNLKLKYEN